MKNADKIPALIEQEGRKERGRREGGERERN